MEWLRMYSIRDGAVGAFMRPFFARSDGEARRQFSDLLRDPQSPVAQHPEDYCLFYVGQVSQESGAVQAPSQPESLGLASSYVVHGGPKAVS